MADDMPTSPRGEHELGARLRAARSSPPADSTTLDAEAIISAARRRRRPKAFATVALSTLAIAGVGFVTVTGVGAVFPMATSESASSDSMADSPADSSTDRDDPMGASSEESGGAIGSAPASRLNLCEGELASVAAHSSGLTATPMFDASVELPDTERIGASDTIVGSVELENTSAERIVGEVSTTPAITLSRDGLVVWHSDDDASLDTVPIDLDAGETMMLEAALVPATCTISDDTGESDRSALEVVAPGRYDVGAALDIVIDTEQSTAAPGIVVGPLVPISLE